MHKAIFVGILYMVRGGLFWKTLLPIGALIVATMLVTAADPPSPFGRLVLFALIVAAAVFHAWWIVRSVSGAANSLADSINRLGRDECETYWRDGQPSEATSLVNSVADLEHRLTDRIAELDSLSKKHLESTALLRAVLATMVEGVVVLDSDQRILFANEAARPLLDVQTADVLNRPLWEVARLAPVNQLVERVLETGGHAADEYKIPRTKLVVAVTAGALPRKPIPGAMLVLHDVTDLRRLESMRRDFVSNVSHELKTPLTSIQAYADTLLEGSSDDPEQDKHFLHEIVEQSERLAAIILDIIRLGKIESEPDVFDVRPVRVAPVVAGCIEAHAKVAETIGIAIYVKPIPASVTVLADSAELRTMLDNLLDNALSYTPTAGSVTVSLAAKSDEELVGISVADTGIGIPQDQQTRVFERFHRVDRARDRQRGGTGLGLSIVKHLCQLFGGRVELTSELGVGSEFTLWLPRGDTPGNSTEPDSNGSLHNLKVVSLES